MSRARARMARPRRRVDPVVQILVVALALFACITGILGILWARSAIAGRSSAREAQKQVQAQPERTPDSRPTERVAPPVGPLQRAGDPTPIPWDGASRLTVLLMGLDFRDWEEGTDVPRTDSMILMSIDPPSKTVGMLSIPRDLWVNVPGMGYNKINTAYRWGEVYGLDGGGPGLAMQTVEEFLDVPVDFYALVDFNAFVRVIDEMGGLDMHIREEIVVDPIGPNNTVTLQPGVQTLDGATALAYARQRSTVGDDFDRAKRQQEVIMAIRDQVLQFNMLPTLIGRAPRLYREISAGITTNLTFDQIIRLALLAAQVDERAIQRAVIGPPDQVTIATNPVDGQSILLPDPDQIRLLRNKVFAARAVALPAAQPTSTRRPPAPTETAGPPVPLVERMKSERARVVVMNGTLTAGLASKTSSMLKSLEVQVVGEDNAADRFRVTTIYDYTGKPNTVRYLVEQMGLPDARIENRFDPNAPADIELVLGEDWASQQGEQ